MDLSTIIPKALRIPSDTWRFVGCNPDLHLRLEAYSDAPIQCGTLAFQQLFAVSAYHLVI
jgi:hypothetical protein